MNASRSNVMRLGGALLGVGMASAALALPAPSPVTEEVLKAAYAEGKVLFYTSVELELAEKVKAAFQAKYPRIACRSSARGRNGSISVSRRNTGVRLPTLWLCHTPTIAG